MTSDPEQPPCPARAQRAAWHARWMIGAGVILIVCATLNLSRAGYGMRPRRDFAQRKSYDMVKPDVHRALPLTIVLGMGGLILILAAGRVRRAGSQERDPRDQRV